MSAPITVGSVVRLNGGGPQMTIEGIIYPPKEFSETAAVVDCVWIDDGGMVHRATFPTYALTDV